MKESLNNKNSLESCRLCNFIEFRIFFLFNVMTEISFYIKNGPLLMPHALTFKQNNLYFDVSLLAGRPENVTM